MKKQKTGGRLHGGDPDARREAARLMGSVSSEKKTAAARANAQKTYKPMKALVAIACACDLPAGEVGRPPVKHKSTCLRGRAIKYRIGKGLALT